MKIIATPETLNSTFSMLCKKYDSLRMAVAWCGSPNYSVPFAHLDQLKVVEGVIGTKGYNSHPEGLRRLSVQCRSLHVVKPDQPDLFHPKLYIFGNGSESALLVGSSNFSAPAFSANHEFCVLIEGPELSAGALADAVAAFERWQSAADTFTYPWLKLYETQYRKVQDKMRRQKVQVPDGPEVGVDQPRWLVSLDWPSYFTVIKKKLSKKGVDFDDPRYGYGFVLAEYRNRVKLPFSAAQLDDAGVRRVLLGTKKGEIDLGWFGHIGASGRICQLLASGTAKEKAVIANAMNGVAGMASVDYPDLRAHLNRLTALGPSMRVWGRLLCLARPDLFFTVSNQDMCAALGKAIGIGAARLTTVDGYIQAHQLLSRSLWFDSKKPPSKNKAEISIWESRAALLDAIFYE